VEDETEGYMLRVADEASEVKGIFPGNKPSPIMIRGSSGGRRWIELTGSNSSPPSFLLLQMQMQVRWASK
jgi:hypothetical protein